VGAGLIVVALVLKVFLFDVAQVMHNGMAPTLLRGERVLINKRATPEIGSIAVCRHPTEDGWVVARVAATGGMTVDSFGNELRIDGKLIPFTRNGKTFFRNTDNDLEGTVIWGDEYFGTERKAAGTWSAKPRYTRESSTSSATLGPTWDKTAVPTGWWTRRRAAVRSSSGSVPWTASSPPSPIGISS